MSLRARNGRKASLVALAADYPLNCVRKKVWTQHIGEHSWYYGTVGASGKSEREGGGREGERERERGWERREKERGDISIETVIQKYSLPDIHLPILVHDEAAISLMQTQQISLKVGSEKMIKNIISGSMITQAYKGGGRRRERDVDMIHAYVRSYVLSLIICPVCTYQWCWMPRLILWYTVQGLQRMWELGEEADLDHLCEGEGGRERGREGGRERERVCVCVWVSVGELC